MKVFKELDKSPTHEVEKKILKVWEEKDILSLTVDNRANNESYVFYDGPATANAMPGVHHMISKILKDAFCKYKTMQGYRVVRKAGWDTHGLPVELQIEKQLGLKSKKEIEEYGIEAFNKKCRESVFVNEEAFTKLTKEMGQFIDLKDPYVTYTNNYMETEWWILKRFFDEELFYEGHKILPYCSRCGTGLASHEVAQGYKDITVNTVIVSFKLKDEDTNVLVWTTTPWTLLANVGLCVNPTEEYVRVLARGNQYIVAKKLVNKVLGDEYEILSTLMGRDLEYKEYEQLLPFVKLSTKAFYITCDDFVTMEDGTGIVHLAPAFGAADYEVGKKYNLPMAKPVGDDGKYTEGPWVGQSVTDPELEIDIIKYLKEHELLFKKEKLTHSYPHCWRCDTPLLYFSRPSWYIKTTAIKDKIIANNNKIEWYPAYVGEKRFGNWLLSMNDWAISRSRYWGTPLPLWRCSCGYDHMIGSVAELASMATTKIDPMMELHRPYIDNVYLKCPKCNQTMTRVKDVIDVWFDSGSMPFAQYHYPFENKELFDAQYPADFICEGIDQTRGWFYVMLVISTFITGQSSFKRVLVNDLVVDKYGKKMSKSKGNSVNPFNLINQYGSDTIRWYLPSVSPVWTPIKFDEDGLKETYSKFINTFKNTYSFFQMYANADHIDPSDFYIKPADRDFSDQWLLSKLNTLIMEVTASYEEFDLTKVIRNITNFINDDLSNWYIRINRRRFWESILSDDKKSVYLTTYETLVILTKLIAPIAPFISEEIYQNLTGELSVHLADFPKTDASLVDLKLEQQMDLIKDICSLGRDARETAKIKVRQPISEILLASDNQAIIGNHEDIIKEELNIKHINYIKQQDDYMFYIVKPNFKEVGKILGPKINLFKQMLEAISHQDVMKLMDSSLTLVIDEEDFIVTKDMVEITAKVKDGYCSSSNLKTFVILNTTLTDALIDEGIMREFVRKVQSIRKDLDLIITENIIITYYGSDAIKAVVNQYFEYIKSETLALDIVYKNTDAEAHDINDLKVQINIERTNK